MNSSLSQKIPMPGARELVAMMAAIMALNALAIDTMLPGLPDIGTALKVTDPNGAQYVISVYLLGLGIGSIFYGPLSDRFGRKAMLMPAICGYAAFSLACSFAPTFEILLAMRLVQGICGAAMGVLVAAIIRDRFEGDKMARHMSMIFMVFMIVPVLAPSFGALILKVAPWRAIFDLFAFLALILAIWVWRRLPETLDAANVIPILPANIWGGCKAVMTHRSAIGYVLASAIIQGAMYGFLASSEQIFSDGFNAREFFPIGFAIMASGIAVANFTNARIVERFGARRVSHTAIFLFIGFGLLQLLAAVIVPKSLPVFLAILTCNMALIGFLGSNFSSIAMQPFGAMAGIASSFQQSVRQILGAAIGATIGAQFNGSPVPIILGFCGCGLISLMLIFWCERGRLFTRPRITQSIPM